MTARTVDRCLDEIDRLRAKNAATQGHLWAAESLLKRVARVLPTLIAPSPYAVVARDTLVEEIGELLAEDREHPGSSVPLGDGEVPMASSGDAERDGTT